MAAAGIEIPPNTINKSTTETMIEIFSFYITSSIILSLYFVNVNPKLKIY